MATITWQKSPKNPLPSLGAEPGTWRADASMTVDVLPRDDHLQIFYVGTKDGHDSIGIATNSREGFDGTGWTDYATNPVLSPGEPGSYDSTHIVDPACVELEGRVYLYYSAIGDGPDSIGLAISDDGLQFEKEQNPVLVGRAPEAVLVNDAVYMLYSLNHPNGGYAFHLATSPDGKQFREEGLVFAPAGEDWDGFSVVTPRVFHEDGIFVMTYAGDDEEKDYPKSFGLAFSRDMRSWVRYPDNPVLSGGPPGSWDWRAVWYAEILKYGDRYYMWYEGYNEKKSEVGLAVSDSPIIEIARSVLDAS